MKGQSGVVVGGIWIVEIGAFAAECSFGDGGRHGHFNVELDDVGDRVELYVIKGVQKWLVREGSGRLDVGKDVHYWIWERREADDHDLLI